jgi:long-chain acyl-CoA synthetase
MLVHEILDHAVETAADRPAVWFRQLWRTYGELGRDADSVAAHLIECGVQAGDRVAILLENSFEYITAHFGALKAGAVDVSLNTELKAEDIRALLIDCGAKVLITSRKLQRGWGPAVEGASDLQQVVVVDGGTPGNVGPKGTVRFHDWKDVVLVARKPARGPGRVDVDLASIIYTSGVTGRPKGVMLSHLNLVSNTRSIVRYLELRDSDRMLVVLPFYYVYGRSLLYTHFLSAGSLVVDNRFAFPMVVLETLDQQQVTALAGVPSTFSMLLHRTDVKRRRFPHLRFLTQAGGGMAPALQKEVVEAFHPARLFVMYGSTEAAPRLTYVPPETLPGKWGSIGKAIPNVEVLVADETGHRVPARTEGEIVARGSNIMMGYWKDPAATAQVLRHGYYFTGDLGYEDADGFIFLTGRSRDFIKVLGNRVGAKEIEDALLELPGVAEAAVVGIPDEILGEAIKAFVVPSDGALTTGQVRDHLSRRLPSFKLPKEIEIRPELPKNQSGKILKAALRDSAATRGIG